MNLYNFRKFIFQHQFSVAAKYFTLVCIFLYYFLCKHPNAKLIENVMGYRILCESNCVFSVFNKFSIDLWRFFLNNIYLIFNVFVKYMHHDFKHNNWQSIFAIYLKIYFILHLFYFVLLIYSKAIILIYSFWRYIIFIFIDLDCKHKLFFIIIYAFQYIYILFFHLNLN